MKTIKKTNYLIAVMIAATFVSTASSCKKENENEPKSVSAFSSEKVLSKSLSSPWQMKSSGVAASKRGIVEMSEPNQTTCYGILFEGIFVPTHHITYTHDGGATWHSQNIEGLHNNFLFGIAATTEKTVHAMGWNYVNGGGNILRSTDGGNTWQREAANAYTNPESFPDAIKFFDADNGVIIGDPQNGYFEIYTTNNGGNKWSRVPSANIPAAHKNEYGSVYITDTYKNTIWTITQTVDTTGNVVSARLMQSDDKGLHWYIKNSALPVNGGDGTIKFRSYSVGLFKNNGVLYRTYDGGATWNVVNYSGTWFSFDFDNIPGKPGYWISTGGGPKNTVNSLKGIGSSITYDDGNHWSILDTAVNHTCVDITSATHGYSGGISTSGGNDGVFIYSSAAKLPE